MNVYVNGQIEALLCVLLRLQDIPDIKFMIWIPDILAFEIKSNLKMACKIAKRYQQTRLASLFEIVLENFWAELAEVWAPYWRAAKIIQKRWSRCYWDPSHPVCQKRLRREFCELTNG
jgi:hypothetical protein